MLRCFLENNFASLSGSRFSRSKKGNIVSNTIICCYSKLPPTGFPNCPLIDVGYFIHGVAKTDKYIYTIFRPCVHHMYTNADSRCGTIKNKLCPVFVF
jgi:hypothetical protein